MSELSVVRLDIKTVKNQSESAIITLCEIILYVIKVSIPCFQLVKEVLDGNSISNIKSRLCCFYYIEPLSDSSVVVA